MKFKVSIKLLIKLFFLQIIGTFFLIAFYSEQIFTDKKLPYLYDECLINNSSQFYVDIDGSKYPKFVPLYENKSIDFKCLNSTSSKKRKVILLWNSFTGLPLPLHPYETGYVKPFESLNCPVTNCELTNDRQKLNVSDLVLVHMRADIDYIQRESLKQRLVHVAYESPVNCYLCTRYKNIFNLSATYTLNSDYTSIYWTNAGIEWKENKSFDVNYDFHSNKKKFAAAVISNCVDSSLRMKFIESLKKYIEVDVYGGCGRKCIPDSICDREILSHDYKFYFAFENSLCTDYITEKFFSNLKYNFILVTLGGGNYSHYVPKSAYIDALDYKTPKDLANYLIYLSNNKTAYNEYFKWKKYISFYHISKIKNSGYLCEMCIQLHLEERLGYIKKKALDNYNLDYLFGSKENCFNSAYQKMMLMFNFPFVNV